MADKRMTEDEVVAELRDGMTVGIGGWGSRRKPMALVRAILRSPVKDLTVVSYGGPDVGLLAAAGKLRRLIYGFVSLDSIPLEPHFRLARQGMSPSGVGFECSELDEGMFQWGLYAAALRLPFLPTRAGLGSDVLRVNPWLETVRSPYPVTPGGDDHETLVAMPALALDVALVHVHRADQRGNGQILGPDPFFDDLFCRAAQKRYVSTERLVETSEFASFGPPESLRLNRMDVDGVIELPHGAHFTSCEPDYGRDEPFQKEYAGSAASPEAWAAFRQKYLELGSHAEYRKAVGR